MRVSPWPVWITALTLNEIVLVRYFGTFSDQNHGFEASPSQSMDPISTFLSQRVQH